MTNSHKDTLNKILFQELTLKIKKQTNKHLRTWVRLKSESGVKAKPWSDQTVHRLIDVSAPRSGIFHSSKLTFCAWKTFWIQTWQPDASAWRTGSAGFWVVQGPWRVVVRSGCISREVRVCLSVSLRPRNKNACMNKFTEQSTTLKCHPGHLHAPYRFAPFLQPISTCRAFGAKTSVQLPSTGRKTVQQTVLNYFSLKSAFDQTHIQVDDRLLTSVMTLKYWTCFHKEPQKPRKKEEKSFLLKI